jgi:opacity protein-like surface antigen
MKRAIIISLALVIAAFAGATLYVPVAEAQTYTAVRPDGRGGQWEFILPITFTDSATVKGQGGSSVDINSDWGGGFGFGYNINDRFQINGIYSWGYRSYDATIVGTDGSKQKYNSFMNTATLALNGIFYILDGNVAPFVSGGIGITHIDTNIPSGSSSTNCWYDPWWGYMCSSYVPTKTQDDVSYTAGLGLRWDINRMFSLQGAYNKMWIDIQHSAGGMPDFDIFRLDFIFRM